MAEPGTDLSVVLVTAPDMETAARLGRVLVEERLAACANLVPGAVSVYRWKGAVEQSDEVLMIVKSRVEAFERIRGRVVELHPYDTPEIVALEVGAVDSRFAAWVRDAVGGES